MRWSWAEAAAAFNLAIYAHPAVDANQCFASKTNPTKCQETAPGFRYYRLSVRSSNGAQTWCFDEIQFYGPSGLLTLAGKESATGSYFDIRCGTDSQVLPGGCFFCSNPTASSPQWWEYDFGELVQVQSYQIRSLSQFDAVFMPRTWTFEGSNDYSMWTVLHKEADYNTLSWGARGSSHMFPCSGTPAWVRQGAGICVGRDVDFTRGDDLRFGSSWGLHPGLGWRYCDEQSDEACQNTCDMTPGCRMVSNSECCFLFKARKCSVSAAYADYRLYARAA